jgi:hypothetical protein
MTLQVIMYKMRNKYNCISVVSITNVILIAFCIILPNLLSAQQSPSIQTGVTFQWSDTQSDLNDPASIQSVTINGLEYNTFVVPTSYEMTRLGPDGHNPNRIILNGLNVGGNSNSANWNSDAIASFQDKNLNHYFNAIPNGRDFCSDFNAAANTDAQKQTLFYSPAIPSNEGGVLAVTERGANNCFYIEVWGIPASGGVEQKLGETFIRNIGDYRGCDFGAPVAGSDYWKSGRCNENGQTIGIGLFYLNDIAPSGSSITKIEFIGASRDHGDGKFFILQKYALDQQNMNCIDTPYNGDLNVNNNVPDNSTYSLVSNPIPAGLSFTLNTDGTYSYTPNNGYTGNVTFEYQVCLPSPNETICGEASASINFMPLPAVPQASISCSTANNDFSITITSPIGATGEFEYALNNGTYQSSPVFNNLTDNSYIISVISTFTKCENINTIPFIIDNLELTGIITDVLCKPDETGAINITASGGAPPYTYAWSNSAISEDLSGISGGTYTVTVTDTNGCIITEDFTVNQPLENLTSIISPPAAILCNGDATGVIDLTISGGTSPYTVLWNNGATTQDLSGLLAGDYNVTITDANGCIISNQSTIIETADKVSGSIIQVTNVDCLNESTGSITGEGTGGIPPYSYSINNGTTTQPSGLFENLTAGNYTFLISDANGCAFSINETIGTDDIQNPEITVPATLTIEGCSAIAITTGNAVFTYSITQSGDVQSTFASNTDYNATDDFNIQSITYIDVITSTNNCVITVSRTFTITDNCNNTATASQIITVEDTTPPTFTAPDDIEIFTDASCAYDASVTATGDVTNEADNL